MSKTCVICNSKISSFEEKSYFDKRNPNTQMCYECARAINLVRAKKVDTYGGIKAFSDRVLQLKQSATKGLGDQAICKKVLDEIAELDHGYESVQQCVEQTFAENFPNDTSNNIGGVLITNSDKKTFATIESGFFLGHIHEFSDLADFDVCEDGQSIGSGKTAVVGALLAGAAGAVVGSAMTKKSAIVNQLDIVLSLKGLDAPTETIKLIEGPVEKQSNLYAKKADLCQRVVSVLKQILDLNKEQKLGPERGAKAIYAFSVADEIMKFKKLMDEGVITRDEFDMQKAKLLSLEY